MRPLDRVSFELLQRNCLGGKYSHSPFEFWQVSKAMGIQLVFVRLGDFSLTEQMNLVRSINIVLPAPKHATNPMTHVEFFYRHVNRSLIDAGASKSFEGLTKSEES